MISEPGKAWVNRSIGEMIGIGRHVDEIAGVDVLVGLGRLGSLQLHDVVVVVRRALVDHQRQRDAATGRRGERLLDVASVLLGAHAMRLAGEADDEGAARHRADVRAHVDGLGHAAQRRPHLRFEQRRDLTVVDALRRLVRRGAAGRVASLALAARRPRPVVSRRAFGCDG